MNRSHWCEEREKYVVEGKGNWASLQSADKIEETEYVFDGYA